MFGMNTLEEVKRTIDNHGVCNAEVNSLEWPSQDLLERRIEVLQAPDEINYISIGETEVSYLYSHAYSERPKRSWKDEDGKLLPKEERVNIAKTEIVFFHYKSTIYAAFLTHAESTIKNLKRELLIPEHWGEIASAVNFEVDEDFLYWLIYRRTKFNGSITKEINITGINAYVGLMVEGTQSMSAEGERVLELLGSLANIFGNEPIDSANISIRLKTETCTFKIYRSGQVKIDDNSYLGNYCGNHIGRNRGARICLVIYTLMIPALQLEYDNHKKNNQWSVSHRISFINDTGKEILKRIVSALKIPEHTSIKDVIC